MSSNNLDRLHRLLDSFSTAEERLIISNAYLGAIFENSHDAIIAKDLGRTITAWNPAAENLYGFSSEEAVGADISLIVPPDKRKELDSLMEKVSHGEAIEPFETERLHKDGRRISVVLTVSPIKDRAGKVIGASAIAHPTGSWEKTVGTNERNE